MGKLSTLTLALTLMVILIGVVAADTVTLRPSGAGDLTQHFVSGETANYLAVDEETSDDSSTTVYTGNNYDYYKDLYNLPNPGLGGEISKITIYARILVGYGNIAVGNAYFLTKTHSTEYTGSISPTSGYTDYLYTYSTNPFTGSAWTWDEINNLQIGVYANSGAASAGWRNTKTTQVYAVVTYTLPDPPSAAFSANTTSGVTPLTVAFTDSSTNTPGSWNWSFGDGEYSNDQNPVHTYLSVGLHTVNLTVTNAGGSDSEVKTDYITVSLPPTLNPHTKYTTFPTPPTGYSVTTYPAEGVTCSKATLKGGIDTESEVWFEYGFTSGTYSYSTEHKSCSAGNQTKTINGIPLTAGKTVYYRAVTPYGYGEEMNFTTLELGATAFPTSTYSIYVTQFFETEGNFTAMAEVIWNPYIAKFGTMFFSILIGVIFLGLAAKQGSSFIPLLVIFIIGIPIFVMLAPEFLWLAQALIILGVGIAIYHFLTQPR